MAQNYPLPPFNEGSARKKVQFVEKAWNSRDKSYISSLTSKYTEWKDKEVTINGRDNVERYVADKWKKVKELKYKKDLWTFGGNRIAVVLEYEYKDSKDQWYKGYGNECWEFDNNGLMSKRYASVNDTKISEDERKLK